MVQLWPVSMYIIPGQGIWLHNPHYILQHLVLKGIFQKNMVEMLKKLLFHVKFKWGKLSYCCCTDYCLRIHTCASLWFCVDFTKLNITLLN